MNELRNLGLCSSGVLRGIGWQLVTDVAEQSVSSVVQSHLQLSSSPRRLHEPWRWDWQTVLKCW